MMRNFEDMTAMVRQNPEKRRVVVAAAHDAHTLEGINRACIEGIVTPILVGDGEKIKEIAREHGFDLSAAQLVEEKENEGAAKKSVELIRNGQGDFLMKGKLQTAELLREVVNKETGLQAGNIMSHVGLFQIPGYHKLVTLTDGGMVLAPDVHQKKQILENALEILHNLGYRFPNVAVLAGTEVVNPKMPESVDAGLLKEWNQDGNLQGCVVEGPISYDLAFSKESAAIKGYESPVVGDTDILLVPNMTTGNLLAKCLMITAGAKMAGIIAGAKVPIVLVSRGATSEEKFLSLVLAAAASK